MTEFLTVVVGVVVGFSAGIFGIGGALLATPLLRLVVGIPGVFAVATPLPAAIPAALSGSIVYLRHRMIRFDVAWRTLAAAVPVSQFGVYLTAKSSDAFLMVLTGVVLTYSAVMFIQRGYARKEPPKPVDPNTVESPAPLPVGMLYAVGAFAGFLSGYLAIGGGIVLVPAFVKLLKLPTKDAVATSLFCVAGLAIPGTLGHWYAGNIMWDVALWLSIGVVPLGYWGARVATALRTSTLERTYGIVMLTFAVYFTLRYLF